MKNIITITLTTILTFIFSLLSLENLANTKLNNLIKTLQKSKMPFEEKFILSNEIAQNYSCLLVTIYFGFFFYIFSQGFLVGFDSVMYPFFLITRNFVASSLSPMFVLWLISWQRRGSSLNRNK